MAEDNAPPVAVVAHPSSAKQWISRAVALWPLTKRAITLSAVAVTIWVAVGCLVFTEWWFSFLWGGEFNLQTAAEGVQVLMDDYLPLVVGIAVVACATVVLGTVFRARLLRFVDRFAVNIMFASFVVLFTSALVVYHAQRAQQELMHGLQVNLLAWDQVEAFLKASNAAPHVPTPVDFRYIDKERVDALYNQIEPDMAEKERTVAASGSVKGKLGVGISGAVNAEAEAAKNVSSTPSFEHATFSSERKCVTLMNYIVDNRQPGYFTNSRGWFWGREKAALVAQIERNKTAPVDLSALRPIPPLDDISTDTRQKSKNVRQSGRRVSTKRSFRKD